MIQGNAKEDMFGMTLSFYGLQAILGAIVFLLMFYKKAKSRKVFIIASIMSSLACYFDSYISVVVVELYLINRDLRRHEYEKIQRLAF